MRLATHAQVWCAFIVSGAELTPIWMATSVANGGFGFSAIDIGAFGGVMGVIILVFAATLFSNLANAVGVTTAVLGAHGERDHLPGAPFGVVCASRRKLRRDVVAGRDVRAGTRRMGPVVMGGVS